MSDYDRDRGAYSPPGEAPLAFDARQPAMRGAGRPPTTLIISAVILLVLVVALIFYYRSGVRRSGEPPVVGAPLSDMKQAAPASAQPAPDTAAGLQVYSAEEPNTAAVPAPTFTPEPETPAPRPAPSQTPSAAAPVQAPAASAPVAASPARPAPPPRQLPAPAPPSPAPAAAASGAGAFVQIGAFSTPALADKGWNDVARLMPGDMVGRTKKVEPTVKDDKTLYRAYVGGFGSKSEASTFCGELKAAGRDCSVR